MNRFILKAATIAFVAFFISSCATKKASLKTNPTAETTPPIINNTNNKKVPSNAGRIQFVNPQQFKKLLLLEEIQLVDVRTLEEFEAGHIKNASNIDVKQSNFKMTVAKLDKNKPVLVYCRSGKRSTDAAVILKGMGFTKIVSLEGGMISWEAANLPTNK